MNVLAVGILLFLALVFDEGFGTALRIGPFGPSAAAVAVVFLSLHAPRAVVPWIGWFTGLMIDLGAELAHEGWGSAPMIGPHALGWCFGAYLVAVVRSMLFTRQLHTIAVMTVLFTVAANLGAVFVLAVHGLYEPGAPYLPGGSGMAELGRRLASGLASGALGLVLGPLLTILLPVFAFRAPMPRAGIRAA